MPTTTKNSGMSAIQGLQDTNTQKVLNRMRGIKTAEEIVAEFFGLNIKKVFNHDGSQVIDIINDFKDVQTLAKKGVRYVPRFKEIGIREEMFISLFPNGLPTEDEIEEAKKSLAKPIQNKGFEAKREELEAKWKAEIEANNKEKEEKMRAELEAKLRVEIKAELENELLSNVIKDDTTTSTATAEGDNSGRKEEPGDSTKSNETKKK